MESRWTDERCCRVEPCAGAGRRGEGGYSLIELVTVVGILGVVMAAAFYFFFAGLNRTSGTEARKNALSAERVAIERITRDVREGTEAIVRSSYSGGEVAAGNVVDVTQPDERIIYDCTTGTCQRYVLDPVSAALLVGPIELIAGLDVATEVFSSGSQSDNADTEFVNVRIGFLPERRERAIVLKRSASIRNRCPAPASTKLPACPS